MEITTKYINKDDFKNVFGIDLELELKSSGNPGDTPEAFIFRLEKRLATFLDAKFYRNIDKEYPQFSDYQKENYSLALLEQGLYILRNGDISVDSGYSYDAGEISSTSLIEEKSIAPNCKQHLLVCGLWCSHIKGRRYGGSIW